jgi:hypothetical protein
MPAERLKQYQLSRRWRTTTVANTPYVSALLDGEGPVASGYDLVALLGYDGAPSRNMLRDALDFGDAWTKTNTTPVYAGSDPPDD